MALQPPPKQLARQRRYDAKQIARAQARRDEKRERAEAAAREWEEKQRIRKAAEASDSASYTHTAVVFTIYIPEAVSSSTTIPDW